MKLLPFTISGFTFHHVVDGDGMDEATREMWFKFHGIADYADLGVMQEEHNFGFEVRDPLGDYYGAFGLYRCRAVDGDPFVVSALPAPLFPEAEYIAPATMEFAIPEEIRHQDGHVINADYIAECQDAEQRFWRRAFGTKEWMTSNSMPIDGGGEFRVDHFRYPSAGDGDPVHHRWIKRDVFDSYCKHICEFDSEGAATRTTGNKTDPPDPTRMFGSFDG